MKAPALLCPGQGAQTVGMGRDLAETYPAAGRVFREANEALGVELDRLCFEGPIEELSRSDVSQPAIVTVSVAALRAMAEATGKPVPVGAAAGLSLGEYTALVAAGVLEFTDAVRLVRRRGTFMQEACETNPGAMYSVIGLEDAQVEEACARVRETTGGRVWPANYNSPGQLVISGETEAAEAAADLCTEAGARRAIRLNVAGAFHTEMMQPAADRLRPLLHAVPMRSPRCAVVANVTARPVDEPDEIRDLLERQVTNPVRWTDSMRWLAAQGCRECYEVGPGRVLQGLLKRTDRAIGCQSIGTAEDVQAYARQQAAGATD